MDDYIEDEVDNDMIFINVSYEGGEATVSPMHMQTLFENQSTLWNMDVLSDIIYDLNGMYKTECKKFDKEMKLLGAK